MLARRGYDRSVDVFSAGVILSVLITRTAAQQRNEPEYKFKMAELKIPDECPPIYIELLKKMVATNPMKRPNFEGSFHISDMIDVQKSLMGLR